MNEVEPNPAVKEKGEPTQTPLELIETAMREIHRVLVAHLHDLYAFYGEHTGVRIARKHISWYTKGLAGSASFRHAMNQLQTCAEQMVAVDTFFSELASQSQRLTYVEELAA